MQLASLVVEGVLVSTWATIQVRMALAGRT